MPEVPPVINTTLSFIWKRRGEICRGRRPAKLPIFAPTYRPGPRFRWLAGHCLINHHLYWIAGWIHGILSPQCVYIYLPLPQPFQLLYMISTLRIRRSASLLLGGLLGLLPLGRHDLGAVPGHGQHLHARRGSGQQRALRHGHFQRDAGQHQQRYQRRAGWLSGLLLHGGHDAHGGPELPHQHPDQRQRQRECARVAGCQQRRHAQPDHRAGVQLEFGAGTYRHHLAADHYGTGHAPAPARGGRLRECALFRGRAPRPSIRRPRTTP